MKKKYIKPSIEVITVLTNTILVSSNRCPICDKPGNHYGYHKNEFNELEVEKEYE